MPEKGSSPIASTTSRMFELALVVLHDIRAPKSVLNIEGIAKGSVKRGSLQESKLSYDLVVNDGLRDRHEAVASDDAVFGQTFFRADFNF